MVQGAHKKDNAAANAEAARQAAAEREQRAAQEQAQRTAQEEQAKQQAATATQKPVDQTQQPVSNVEADKNIVGQKPTNEIEKFSERKVIDVNADKNHFETKPKPDPNAPQNKLFSDFNFDQKIEKPNLGKIGAPPAPEKEPGLLQQAFDKARTFAQRVGENPDVKNIIGRVGEAAKSVVNETKAGLKRFDENVSIPAGKLTSNVPPSPEEVAASNQLKPNQAALPLVVDTKNQPYILASNKTPLPQTTPASTPDNAGTSAFNKIKEIGTDLKSTASAVGNAANKVFSAYGAAQLKSSYNSDDQKAVASSVGSRIEKAFSTVADAHAQSAQAEIDAANTVISTVGNVVNSERMQKAVTTVADAHAQAAQSEADAPHAVATVVGNVANSERVQKAFTTVADAHVQAAQSEVDAASAVVTAVSNVATGERMQKAVTTVADAQAQSAQSEVDASRAVASAVGNAVHNINHPGTALPPAAQGLEFSQTKGAAKLAYDAQKGQVYNFDGGKGGQWQVADVNNNANTGFRAIALKATDPNDKRTIVAFAGTDPTSGKDWGADVQQGLGFSTSQYNEAVDYARKWQASDGNNVILTGHSLGGGLASYAAGQTGLRATGVNSAQLTPNHIGPEQTEKNITHYYVPGEIMTRVDRAFGPGDRRPGNEIAVEGKGSYFEPVAIGTNHTMDNVAPEVGGPELVS